ncbi:MAG TPA: neutral zinc metallopeptidase [Thermoanaerobaculia bacterium]
MRWTPGGESGDVEDRRGSSGIGGAHIGIGGAIVLLVLSLIFHRNFFALFEGGSATTNQPAATRPINETPQEHREVQFVSFVLDDAQSTWNAALGPQYRHAKLVLFRDAINSACGFAQAASGPFYCPDDEKVYLDLGFFDELRDRFAASGDFAQAYVITHELGHHVQKVLGIEPRVHDLMEQNPRRAKEYSARLELQADCFAGVWGHSTAQRNILESGDIEEGLNAASAVGDDRIQRMSGRRVNPESFTHGSSRERATWFRRGLESGRIEDCDTFRGQVRQ